MSYFMMKLREYKLKARTPAGIVREAMKRNNPAFIEKAIALALTGISEHLRTQNVGVDQRLAIIRQLSDAEPIASARCKARMLRCFS